MSNNSCNDPKNLYKTLQNTEIHGLGARIHNRFRFFKNLGYVNEYMDRLVCFPGYDVETMNRILDIIYILKEQLKTFRTLPNPALHMETLCNYERVIDKYV